jgi:hypothetical protein
VISPWSRQRREAMPIPQRVSDKRVAWISTAARHARCNYRCNASWEILQWALCSTAVTIRHRKYSDCIIDWHGENAFVLQTTPAEDADSAASAGYVAMPEYRG